MKKVTKRMPKIRRQDRAERARARAKTNWVRATGLVCQVKRMLAGAVEHNNNNNNNNNNIINIIIINNIMMIIDTKAPPTQQ